LIEQLGHAATVAPAAADALALLEAEPHPDVVLSDIVMAGELNGLGLARQIRLRWPALPVVLVTGYSREAEAIGDEFPVLAKPYELAALSRALATAALAATDAADVL
jgi:CheY-like chemotaxis protein